MDEGVPHPGSVAFAIESLPEGHSLLQKLCAICHKPYRVGSKVLAMPLRFHETSEHVIVEHVSFHTRCALKDQTLSILHEMKEKAQLEALPGQELPEAS